jgi:hypothetical protein
MSIMIEGGSIVIRLGWVAYTDEEKRRRYRHPYHSTH